MDPFLAPDWNQLQTILWFYSRSRIIARLAADQRPRSHDLDDQADPPGFDDDTDLIGAVVPFGRIWELWRSCLHTDLSFEDTEEQVLEHLRRGRLRASGRKNGEGICQ